MQLSEAYLNEGRTIVTDNFYAEIELAKELLDKNTHLIGILRKNRKGLPKEVTSTKLKKGEILSREDLNGIVILKRRDQRDVYEVNTCHTLDKIAIVKKNRKNEDIVKPQFIVDYNMSKALIYRTSCPISLLQSESHSGGIIKLPQNSYYVLRS
ncbi:hypothetical protein NQ314_007580 [Rhamnusium bicolor]|uniref:PiggyBac transposable element-derived protein domain-containing protein n=1 Tax=Rhamnusium bicolor TaxID=1586634 RepID=A0AAV8YP05_9CUCU|nr:hypothetical protein NQ314_007580 [Rhamnusium bicolor]